MIASIFTIPFSLFFLSTIPGIVSYGDYFHFGTVVCFIIGSVLCVLGALKFEGIKRGMFILSGAILLLIAQPYFPNFIFYIPMFFAAFLVFIFERDEKMTLKVQKRSAEGLFRNFDLVSKNYCEKCGAEMPKYATLCVKCGHEKIMRKSSSQ